VPGLPGAGLGGLFYVLSAFAMLPVEVVQTARGRSSLERWRLVGTHVGLASGVLASFAVALWVLKLAFWSAPEHPPVAATRGSGTPSQTDTASLDLLPVAPVVLTFFLLTALLAITLALGVSSRAKATSAH
jgi:hypothetical protein